MANTKLATVGPIISIEQQTGVFASTATLATAGFTLPSNTGEIWCYPSAACHWTANGAATSSRTHTVRANEMFLIPTDKIGTAQIIGDAGAITLTIANMRGARKAIAHAVSRPT